MHGNETFPLTPTKTSRVASSQLLRVLVLETVLVLLRAPWLAICTMARSFPTLDATLLATHLRLRRMVVLAIVRIHSPMELLVNLRVAAGILFQVRVRAMRVR